MCIYTLLQITYIIIAYCDNLIQFLSSKNEEFVLYFQFMCLCVCRLPLAPSTCISLHEFSITHSSGDIIFRSHLFICDSAQLFTEIPIPNFFQLLICKRGRDKMSDKKLSIYIHVIQKFFSLPLYFSNSIFNNVWNT